MAPYWSALSEFAAREHPGVLICIELHPGTPVYNVETFQRLAALGPNLAANIDPSHFLLAADGHCGRGCKHCMIASATSTPRT